MTCNFDANACYGLLNKVEEELSSYNNKLFNPSSIHSLGQTSRMLIEDSREYLRKLVGIDSSSRIVFTSGATEANNTALFTPFLNLLKTTSPDERKAYSLITTKIEHPSVLEAAVEIESYGFKVIYLDVDRGGTLDKETLYAELKNSKVLLVSIMGANNETGHILNTQEVFSKIKRISPDTLIHSDSVQVIGKLPYNFEKSAADLISISGHKIGALSGVGALIIRDEHKVLPFIFGGPQEMHLRAGTENVLGIVSLGIACRELVGNINNRIQKFTEYRDLILKALNRSTSNAKVLYGIRNNFLPNTLSIIVPGAIADDLVAALDINGIKVSSGAACASGKPDPSHVLLAFGHSKEEAKEVIRISLRAKYNKKLFEKGLSSLIECLEKASKRKQAA